MKEVLIIYYSQSGQLKEIAENLTAPIKNSKHNITYYSIEPETPYSFPWKPEDFYGAFPESFQQHPIPIKAPPQEVLEKEYDLVIFAYQIWFLTPSIPINSFLKSEYASKLLKNQQIITVIGCRNMWAKAQKKTAILIQEAGGKLVGNIAFVDKSPNLISVITIVHWVMGGKKTKKYGIFPKPGVSDEDIENASQFGELILHAMKENNFTEFQDSVRAKGGATLKPFIIFMDEKANKMFSIWSKFVLKSKNNRKFKLKLFKYYLLTALFVISPIVFILFTITYPLRYNQIKKKMEFYCGI